MPYLCHPNADDENFSEWTHCMIVLRRKSGTIGLAQVTFVFTSRPVRRSLRELHAHYLHWYGEKNYIGIFLRVCILYKNFTITQFFVTLAIINLGIYFWQRARDC